MNLIKSLNILYYTGMSLVLAGIIMSLGHIEKAHWIFGLGVIPILGVRCYNRIVSDKERQRINTILIVSALFLAASAYLMFIGRNYWIMTVFISAMIDFYTSFRK